DRRIPPSRNLRTSRSLRRCTAAPEPLLDEPTAPAGTRSCVRKTSGPTASVKPAAPLAGLTGPTPSGCQACASLRPACRFRHVKPVAAHRSHSTVVPASLANAVPSTPVIHPRSSRRFPDSLGSLGLVSMLLFDSLAHILPPSVAGFQPGSRFLSSPWALRSLPFRSEKLHSPRRTGRSVVPAFSAAFYP